MFPSSPAPKRTNVRTYNSILSRDIALSRKPLEGDNLPYFCLREFGRWMALAIVIRPVCLLVERVFRSRNPRQVLQSAIRWIAVQVSGLISFWTRTNKCQQNKLMNGRMMSLVILRDSHHPVSKAMLSTSYRFAGNKPPPLRSIRAASAHHSGGLVETANVPEIAHLIQPFIAGDVAPSFFLHASNISKHLNVYGRL